jgi:type VI secretion system protein ImpF
MPDPITPNPQDRLQPFLLDRLLDDEPDVKQERPERRAMTSRRFRQSVLRDLSWLLNAKAHPKEDGLAEFPEVARSVLNFGLPEVAGGMESAATPSDLERIVRNAIVTYEPRIVRSTLSVRAMEENQRPVPGHSIILEIKGDIRVEPLSEAIYVKTNVDLETGHCEMQE